VKIIEEYGKYVLGLAVALFGLYERFTMVEREIDIIDERLGKKIRIINDHEQRLRNLECK
jgi:hypothetical protein